MYQQHFGLTRPPFKITPDTVLFYRGGNRGATLEALVYSILNGEGIVKVIGEVGSGKTMLCRMLEVTLPGTVELVYLDNPRLSPDHILHAIALEMNLAIRLDDNGLQVMKVLQHHLLEQHTQNHQVVMFVEEAQGMSLETLEEIRLLSNLETQDHKLLQIVLFGQPELDIHLSQPHIRQLRERITHGFQLYPLNTADTGDYLEFRLHSAGYCRPRLFSAGAVRRLSRSSRGLMRRINILADKSLLAAFAEGATAVNARHVKQAILDSEFISSKTWSRAVITAVLGVGLITAVAAWALVTTEDAPVPQLARFDAEAVILHPAPGVTAPAVPSPANAPRTIPVPSAIQSPNIPPGNTNLDGGLLEKRLTETKRWLSQANARNYSIQVLLAGADSRIELQRFLRKTDVSAEVDKLFIYRTRVNGQPVYGVVYNEYESYSQALHAMRDLPASLRRYRPFLRTIHQLQAETEQGTWAENEY